MSKEEIIYLANKHYDRLSEYDKHQLAKKTKIGAITSTVFLCIVAVSLIVMSISSFCKNDGNGTTWLFLFFGVIGGGSIFLSNYKFLAIHGEKDWALTHFIIEIKKANKLAKKDKATFSQICLLHAEEVVEVSLIDRHTEITDKLHGFLNYQEIIQTRYYKFRIKFADGSIEIFQTQENSNDCMTLISMSKNNDL